MSGPIAIPSEVIEAYALDPSSIQPIPSLINLTLAASQRDTGQPLIVQRLHPVFQAGVHHDIAAITDRLEQCGLDTPKLVSTQDSTLWLDTPSGVWRAQTRLDGETVHHVTSPAMAHAAGSLVAKFHRCLSGFDYHFVFARSGVHDTPQHLERLRAAREQALASGDAETAELCDRILKAATSAPLDFSTQPKRICHGDLKISNLLFTSLEPPVARCLIDLDTLGYLPLAHELGDALRSWCNPATEDLTRVRLDSTLFEATLSGYAEAAPRNVTLDEWASIVPGLLCICLELAARFCVDAVEDRYFGWDPGRFGTRREHNLVRARGQLALAESVVAQREPLMKSLRSLAPRV